MKIVVTGSNGQLGSEFKYLAEEYPEYSFVFADRKMLDISIEKIVSKFIEENKPDVLINCAAYTAVDKAEVEINEARLINEEAAYFLAKNCKAHNCKLIHYSSDYVYNQPGPDPLAETDKVNPAGVYARTKLSGEKQILNECPQAIIIRTSWVYSAFGNNFVKTMIRLGKERESLKIVNDQIGTPTYARDIAIMTLKIIKAISKPAFNQYGIFNYSNEGVTNWATFAKKIFELENITCVVYPITTEEFNAAAERPFWSVLSKDKIKGVFAIKIPHWVTSLQKCLLELK